MQPLADQSIFVRAAVNGVIREAVIAACLTALMILLFLGSWRSTLIIAVSIPLSILTSIIVLSALHETINIMTLGGLALAVGILVDDATVDDREHRAAISRRASELDRRFSTARRRSPFPHWSPRCASASSSCRCSSSAAWRATCSCRWPKLWCSPCWRPTCFSRTLVPTLAKYLLKAAATTAIRQPQSARCCSSARSSAASTAPRRLRRPCSVLVAPPRSSCPLFLRRPACRASCCTRGSGRTSSRPPTPASSSCICAPRPAPASKKPRASATWWKHPSAARFRPTNCCNILDNIGLPYSSINTIYSNSAPIGTGRRRHHGVAAPGAPPHRRVRARAAPASLPREFPGTDFYFLPADIVSQILNFGLPAPIDIQVVGHNVAANRDLADRILNQMRRMPGIADLRIQQTFDQPKLAHRHRPHQSGRRAASRSATWPATC